MDIPALPAPEAPSMAEKVIKGISYPFTAATPKWMYPLFGAAALSPIIGYEINKHLSKNKQKPEQTPLDKISAALEIAHNAPSNVISRLEYITSLMKQAKGI